MSLDKKLDALLSNVTPALRDVLRTAYDLGYREALAAGASLHGSSTHARGMAGGPAVPSFAGAVNGRSG